MRVFIVKLKITLTLMNTNLFGLKKNIGIYLPKRGRCVRNSRQKHSTCSTDWFAFDYDGHSHKCEVMTTGVRIGSHPFSCERRITIIGQCILTIQQLTFIENNEPIQNKRLNL